MNENNAQTNTTATAKRRYTKTTPEILAALTEEINKGTRWKLISEKLQVSAPLIFKVKKEMGKTRPYNRKPVASDAGTVNG